MKQDGDVPVIIRDNMSTTNTILGRPLMAMDGNLLSAFWNKGACIPDKLVDKKDILNEVTDEILLHMKLKSDVSWFCCFEKNCILLKVFYRQICFLRI